MNTENNSIEKQGNAVYNVLAAAFILSGKCRIGDVGEPTMLKDFTGKELFVGDIVIVSTIDSMGICDNYGLSVVCSDKWTSYSDGTHVAKGGKIEYFIMGIKNVDFMGADSEKWIVKRVKSYKDVIAGEHWKDYGFSYVAS
jgi:hypothetical protein